MQGKRIKITKVLTRTRVALITVVSERIRVGAYDVMNLSHLLFMTVQDENHVAAGPKHGTTYNTSGNNRNDACCILEDFS
jgi:hypothetical protein